MPTGQAGFDPDDFRDRRDDSRDRQREQSSSDRQRQREQQRRDDMRRDQEESQRERLEALRRVVNDPAITIDNNEKKCINCPDTLMMENGEIVKRDKSGFGSGRFQQQFSELRGKAMKLAPKGRSRGRKALDKLQAEAFRRANERYRRKDGSLRKGRTQKDIAKLAQFILKQLRKKKGI